MPKKISAIKDIVITEFKILGFSSLMTVLGKFFTIWFSLSFFLEIVSLSFILFFFDEGNKEKFSLS